MSAPSGTVHFSREVACPNQRPETRSRYSSICVLDDPVAHSHKIQAACDLSVVEPTDRTCLRVTETCDTGRRFAGYRRIPSFFGRLLPVRPVRAVFGSNMPTLVDDDAGEFPLFGREHHE